MRTPRIYVLYRRRRPLSVAQRQAGHVDQAVSGTSTVTAAHLSRSPHCGCPPLWEPIMFRPALPRPGLKVAALGAATLMAATALTGCGASTEPGERASAAQGSQANSDDAEMKTLWAEFEDVVDMPAKRLTTNLGLKPQAGFAQVDVDALAARAVQVLKRSADPELSDMEPDAAVDYVYEQQYRLTQFNFERDAAAATFGHDWQWLAASRYPATASKARVIKIAAAVSHTTGKTDDGTTEPILRVTVEAHILQTVPDADHGTVPIVVRRAVEASGFKPRGGPDWWPAVITRATPFGNSGCALFKSAELKPLTDPDTLREDLANLNISLRAKSIATTEFVADTSTETRAKTLDWYEKDCDDTSQVD